MKLAGDGKEIPNGKMAHSLRSMGSAALNYGLVAQGGLDVYWCELQNALGSEGSIFTFVLGRSDVGLGTFA